MCHQLSTVNMLLSVFLRYYLCFFLGGERARQRNPRGAMRT